MKENSQKKQSSLQHTSLSGNKIKIQYAKFNDCLKCTGYIVDPQLKGQDMGRFIAADSSYLDPFFFFFGSSTSTGL